MREIFRLLYCIILLLFAAIKPFNAQQYSISQLFAPDNCFGGEPFQFQPSIQILNSNGFLVTDFVGSAYVLLFSSPSGFEYLYLTDSQSANGCDLNNYCGTRVIGTVANVPFVNGIASFKVRLYIFYNLAYHIHF